jgi:hypothetical protein
MDPMMHTSSLLAFLLELGGQKQPAHTKDSLTHTHTSARASTGTGSARS